MAAIQEMVAKAVRSKRGILPKSPGDVPHMSTLVDRISPDYVRPTCAVRGHTMDFVHFHGEGSRYCCLPCEFGVKYQHGRSDYPMTAAEASWIIRNTSGNEVQL